MNKLLFVCGFPSGGTDLTKTVLNAHPQIYLNGEMPLLKNLYQYGYDDKTTFESPAEIEEFQNALRKINTWDNIQNVDHDFRDEFQIRETLSLEDALKISFADQDRDVWGNKTPQNTENIDVLSRMFPDAYFLIVARDVRDVCLSWRNKWDKDLLLCASKWAERMMRGRRSSEALPDGRHLFIKFEDLLSTTEACCRTMCAFLEIPFSDRMLQHNKYTPERLDGKINYGREILADNKDKWRRSLSQAQTVRIEEIAFETMRAFNYEIAFADRPRPITEVEKARGVVNDTWATVFTGNRSSQQNTFGQRMRDLAWELKKRA